MRNFSQAACQRPFVGFIILRHFKTFKPSFAPSATEGQSPDTYTRFLTLLFTYDLEVEGGIQVTDNIARSI